MHTRSATRSARLPAEAPDTVSSLVLLAGSGWTKSAVGSQLRARRWQRFGRAIVTHNATPTLSERRYIALVNAGAKAALTAFSALEIQGLHGWEREVSHVLVPGGTDVRRVQVAPVRIHYVGTWEESEVITARALHRPPDAALLAAATLPNPRHACGLLAALVQQRLARPDQLLAALARRTRVRHRGALLLAAHDIAQGAQALSEIDFARLCRRHHLPPPRRQSIRVERDGRRRYLDAEWDLPDGRRLVVEVDGAVHLVARRWWSDQLRQNEIVIAGSPVLRFPSVVVRTEELLVVDQLRRMLRC